MQALYEQYAVACGDELVEILDASGRPFMVMPLVQAHRQQLCYRVVVCLLYNSDGLLYLQQRSRQSPFFPELWDVPAFAAVRASEAPVEAASRSLYDNLRVKPSSCVEISREFCAPAQGRHSLIVYQALAPSQTPAPDSRDIDKLMGVAPHEFDLLLGEFPDQISPMLEYVGGKGFTFLRKEKF